MEGGWASVRTRRLDRVEGFKGGERFHRDAARETPGAPTHSPRIYRLRRCPPPALPPLPRPHLLVPPPGDGEIGHLASPGGLFLISVSAERDGAI